MNKDAAVSSIFSCRLVLFTPVSSLFCQTVQNLSAKAKTNICENVGMHFSTGEDNSFAAVHKRKKYLTLFHICLMYFPQLFQDNVLFFRKE
jgi:uncharacterized membrane protein